MGGKRDVVSASQFDAMTPQERADAVEESVVRSWDDVEASFRRRVEARARQLAQRSQPDA